ncbi:MAG TPA: hypothetical protein VMY36_00240 [Patescibacteria group bacterium]|nr:hypothetical protein [Patescibacteria group bacterium]
MDVLEEMFGSFEVSALRVETLPVYHIEGGEWEEFQHYKEGIPTADSRHRAWIEDVRAWTRSGKEIKRIRVIPPTLAEYLRYELDWCFPQNWLAGEIIKAVSQRTYEQLVTAETKGDFWIFDQKHVLKMEYDKEGRYLGENLVSDPPLVDSHTTLFLELEQKSIAYTEVIRQIREAKLKVELEYGTNHQ